MQTIKKLLTVLAVMLTQFCQSQTTLSSVEPAKFFTETDPSEYDMHHVTISGKDLWPSYFNNYESIIYIKAYFKKGGKEAEIIKTSGDRSTLTLEFSGSEWLTTTGKIEVYLMIHEKYLGGIFNRTNSVWISVDAMPAIPPVINKTDPLKMTIGKGASTMISIYGDNFGNQRSTTATIGNKNASFGRWDLANGYIYAYIPKDLINTPGTYEVQVHNKYGGSNTVPLVIEKPALNMTRINSPVNISRVNTISTNNTAAVPPTINIAANNRILNAVNSRPAELLAEGIKVTMNGNIAYGEDGAVLEKFISGLDKVLLVNNNFKAGDNSSNIFIELKGNKIAAPELGKVKKTIEDKLKGMGLINAAVVIK